MKLERVDYYRIPRNEDDRRESIYDRTFELALRWEPIPAYHPNANGINPELVESGKRHLYRLVQGDSLSERHLQIGIDYLIEAILYYETTDYEPYPGRNEEAMRDLRALAAELLLPDASVAGYPGERGRR